MKEIKTMFGTKDKVKRQKSKQDGYDGDSSDFDEESIRIDEIDEFKTMTFSDLTSEELDIILEYEDQGWRMGKFERIFPLEENVEYYEEFFPEDRVTHKILWRYLQQKELNLHTYRRFDSAV